jgi:hypothetical protein
LELDKEGDEEDYEHIMMAEEEKGQGGEAALGMVCGSPPRGITTAPIITAHGDAHSDLNIHSSDRALNPEHEADEAAHDGAITEDNEDVQPIFIAEVDNHRDGSSDGIVTKAASKPASSSSKTAVTESAGRSSGRRSDNHASFTHEGSEGNIREV